MKFYSILFAVHEEIWYGSMKSHYDLPEIYWSILTTLLSIQD